MADPDTDCWGWKDLTLMAIPDTRFGGERWWLSCIGGDRRGFSWKFPNAGGECGGVNFHGSLRCWLWGGGGFQGSARSWL